MLIKGKIRFIDIISCISFLLAWPISFFLRLKHKDLWLISERCDEARDNGFWMYNYIRKSYPEQDVYYVIKSNAKDVEKISSIGAWVCFGSFCHYIIYLLATKHISAHVDSDSPNSRVSNFLERHKILRTKRVFLQHGITKDRISFGYYSVSRADLFICAAIPEYHFCRREFGYPEGNVKLLGFARYDGLGSEKKNRQILLLPTWRSWLSKVSDTEFLDSDYYKEYQTLLINESLITFLNENNVDLLFYPHPDLQKYTHLFYSISERIIVVNDNQYDIQYLLNISSMLITDYSSVAFDMGYMLRPVVYYQFDYKEYRKYQHPEGYYKYQDSGFGPVCSDLEMLVSNVFSIVNNNFKMEQEYVTRCNEFFAYRDKNNCSRIYDAIRKL